MTSEPQENIPVEEDRPPTRKLALWVSALCAIIVAAIFGLWRLLVYSTAVEKERKANPETAKVRKLRKENLEKLRAKPVLNPKTGKYSIPIDHAMKLLASDPNRLAPLAKPPLKKKGKKKGVKGK